MKGKFPFELGDDILRFGFCDEKIVNGIYLPVAEFITAYGRDKTIRTSQAIVDYSLRKYQVNKYYYSLTLIQFIVD